MSHPFETTNHLFDKSFIKSLKLVIKDFSGASHNFRRYRKVGAYLSLKNAIYHAYSAG